MNLISWTPDLIRIMSLETISTAKHPAPLVQTMVKEAIKVAVIALLNGGVIRRRSMMAEANQGQEIAEGIAKERMDEESRTKLKQESDTMLELIKAWTQGEDPACQEWNCAMTWIVGRKQLVVGKEEDWMVER